MLLHSTVPKEKADCREWVVLDSKRYEIALAQPGGRQILKLFVTAPLKNAERQLTKPYGDPLDVGGRRAHHPRAGCPPPAPSTTRTSAGTLPCGGWSAAASGERRWWRSRKRRPKQFVDDLRLDDVAKAWIVVGCTSIGRELHNVWRRQRVLLDSLVGAEV